MKNQVLSAIEAIMIKLWHLTYYNYKYIIEVCSIFQMCGKKSVLMWRSML